MAPPTPIPYTGGLIDKPGIYSGIPNEVYHGRLTKEPSVSRSGLSTILQMSPRHFWFDSYLNPNRPKDEPSTAVSLGSAAHHLILGEASFSRHFIVRPEAWDSWRTGASQQWRAEVQASGLTVLTPDQMDLIRGMAESLALEPLIQMGLLNGLIEQSIVWRDEETGVWLKVRPDCIPHDGGDVADLKTVARITDDDLSRSVGDTGMNIQGAMIREALKVVLGVEVRDFVPVFVESKPPHCVQIRALAQEDLDLGHRQFRVAVRKVAHCLKTGNWPGPAGVGGQASYLGMTPWARKSAERQIEIMEADLEMHLND